ncbi:MAG: hypothetical protein LBQ54_07735 [Planctomycetaceae bacterium]|nr:hypothetical protein [Planctomycetaceae bacterium]
MPPAGSVRPLHPRWSCRSESHEPARVAHWEACRFTAHRKRLERFSIGSRMERSDHEAIARPGLPGCNVRTLAAGSRCIIFFHARLCALSGTSSLFVSALF